MKNRNCRLLFVVLAAVGVMLLTACNDLFDVLSDEPINTPKKETPKKETPKKDTPQVEPIQKGYGKVSIIIGGGENGRTVLPPAFAASLFDKYVFTFTDVATSNPTSPVEKTVMDGNLTLELDAGITYSVHVKAFNNDVLAAEGDSEDDVEIEDGQTATVSVKLAPTYTGNGKFSYSITYPDEATLVMTLVKWQGSDFTLTGTTTTDDSEKTKTYSKTAGENLAAGSYVLTVTVTKGISYAGFTEVVRIYDTLTTTLPAKVFGTGDLVNKRQTYTVILHDNYPDNSGSTVSKSDILYPQADATANYKISSLASSTPTAPTDYIFDGWYTVSDDTGGVEFTATDDVIDSKFGFNSTIENPAVNLYARWAKYAITLDKTSLAFDDEPFNYSAVTAKSVTVTNDGNRATGALTVELGGTNSSDFTLGAGTGSTLSGSDVSISDIAATGTTTATFTVVPKTGLAVGSYNATVTVSGGNGISKNINVSFHVVARGFSISGGSIADLNGDKFTFDPKIDGSGYASQQLTVTITNNSTVETGVLTVVLNDYTNFTLNGSNATVNISSIAATGTTTATFTVETKTGLDAAPAPYTATITISGASGNGITSQSFEVEFQVNPPTGVNATINWVDSTTDDPAILGNNSTSVGQPLILSLAEQGFYSYSWTEGTGVDVLTSNTYSFTFTRWVKGTYTVSLMVVKESGGQPYSAIYTVTVQ